MSEGAPVTKNLLEKTHDSLDLQFAKGEISDFEHTEKKRILETIQRDVDKKQLVEQIQTSTSPLKALKVAYARGDLEEIEFDLLKKIVQREEPAMDLSRLEGVEIDARGNVRSSETSPVSTPELVPAPVVVEEPPAPIPAPEREKTPEEIWEERVRKMAWKLLAEDPTKEVPADFELSPKMKSATEKFLKKQEEVLGTYRKRAEIKKRIDTLRAEIKILKREKSPVGLSGKERALQLAENEWIAIKDAAEDDYNKAKEELKRQLLNEFITYKRKFIQDNKSEFLKEYRKRKNLPEDHKLTPEQEKQALKEILEKETLEHGTRVVFYSIYDIDLAFEQEKAARLQESKEKSAVQKMFEKWRGLPLYKRIAVSSLVAFGVGAGIGYVMVPGAVGILGYAGYRAGRAAVGGTFGALFNKPVQGLLGWMSGKTREGARIKQEEQTMAALQKEVEGAVDWLNVEAKKLDLAKIIDQQVDEYKKVVAKSEKKEKTARLLWGILAGVGGGFAGGALYDYLYNNLSQPGAVGIPEKGKAVASGGDTPSQTGKDVARSFIPNDDREIAGLDGGSPSRDFIPNDDREIGGLDYPRADTPGGKVVIPEDARGALTPEGARSSGPPPVHAEFMPGYNGIEHVGPRGVWGMIEHQFRTHPDFSGEFNKLSPAQQTNIIANFLETNKGKFGLADIDRPPRGWTYDFSKLMENKTGIREFVDRSLRLTENQQQFIDNNNQVIAEWVRSHPGEQLTGPRVQEILNEHWRGRGGVNLPEKPSGGGTVPSGEPMVATGGEIKTVLETGEIQVRATEPVQSTRLGFDAPPPTVEGELHTPVPAPEVTPQPTGGFTATPAEVPSGGGTLSNLSIGKTSLEFNTPPPTVAAEPTVPPTPEASPVVQPEVITTPYGTQIEQTLAKSWGFGEGQYNAIKGVTIEKLLKEIPPDGDQRVSMWKQWGANKPPNLPHGGWSYWEWELRRQIKVADYIRSLKPNLELQKLTVTQFLNRFGPK